MDTSAKYKANRAEIVVGGVVRTSISAKFKVNQTETVGGVVWTSILNSNQGQ